MNKKLETCEGVVKTRVSRIKIKNQKVQCKTVWKLVGGKWAKNRFILLKTGLSIFSIKCLKKSQDKHAAPMTSE